MQKLILSDVSLEEKAKIDPKEVNRKRSENDKSTLKDKFIILLRKVKLKWFALTGFQKYLIFSISGTFIIGLLGLYLYIVVTSPVKTPPYLVERDLQFIEVKTGNIREYQFFKLDKPNKPRTEISPINGLLFTEEEMEVLMKRAPVAVMINNHGDARPQSSLNFADIVFEAEAESGITRYMAIYWSHGVDKVGPIRSARQYYLEWLSPYDAIFIHDGYSSSDDPRVNAGGNMYLYGTRTISTNGAWREFDGVRFAPHNEYSSVNYAWEFADTLGWNIFPSDFKAWEFKKDSPKEGQTYGASVAFNKYIPNGGIYDVRWEYNPESNNYLRYFGTISDIDQETDEQVNAKTVIIQETTITQTFDSKGHLIIDTIGNGKATILMDGDVISATWRKNSRTDRTVYYNKDGKEMQFNRGRVWIEVIDPNIGQSAIIEQ